MQSEANLGLPEPDITKVAALYLPGNYIHTVIEPPKGWAALQLSEVWKFRELLFFLTWRDIKVRYKQTALGAAWAVLQPVLTMAVFSIIFGGLAKLPSDGIPYSIFTFTALLPWQLFAFALTQSSNSLVGEQKLISKVLFPRLVVPFSSVFSWRNGLWDRIHSFNWVDDLFRDRAHICCVALVLSSKPNWTPPVEFLVNNESQAVIKILTSFRRYEF